MHRRGRLLFGLCYAELVLSVLLGGGTHRGYLGDVAVQFCAIPLLCAALWPLLRRRAPAPLPQLLFSISIGAIALVTLEVLPLGIDRWGVVSALSEGRATPEPPLSAWRTVSLSPRATLAAAASLLVPLAIFCAAVQLTYEQRMRLCWGLAALGLLSLVFGFLQVLQGPASPLRFYDFTNALDPVGFFANRNHFADLLCVTVVLVFFLWTQARARLSLRTRKTQGTMWFSALLALLIALLAGVALSRSRSGALLAMGALAGVAALALRGGLPAATGSAEDARSGRAALAAPVLALVFLAQFGLGGLLSRLQGDPVEDLRMALNAATWSAIEKTLPAGTGLGTFVPVYAVIERDQDVFAGYANRAHNDVLEFVLEAGLPGAIILLTLLAWFLWRTASAWSSRASGPAVQLARVSSVAIAILALHSLVDYPLRTAALGTVFALFAGFLAVEAAPSAEGGGPTEASSRPRGRARRTLAAAWTGGGDWPSPWRANEAQEEDRS